MILILDMYHKTGWKNFNHYLSLEFNSFLKSSTPISNPFMSLSSHAIFKHIFFDTLWTILLKSPFSKNVSEENFKNFIRSDLDHWDPSQKKSKHSSSIEIVIISQRSWVNSQSLRTSPKNFFQIKFIRYDLDHGDLSQEQVRRRLFIIKSMGMLLKKYMLIVDNSTPRSIWAHWMAILVTLICQCYWHLHAMVKIQAIKVKATVHFLARVRIMAVNLKSYVRGVPS